MEEGGRREGGGRGREGGGRGRERRRVEERVGRGGGREIKERRCKKKGKEE